MQQLIIEQDNQSTLAVIANGRATGPTSRHINIRYFWLNDRLAQGEISMRYMPTNRRRNDYRPVNKAQRWKVILQAQTYHYVTCNSYVIAGCVGVISITQHL